MTEDDAPGELLYDIGRRPGGLASCEPDTMEDIKAADLDTNQDYQKLLRGTEQAVEQLILRRLLVRVLTLILKGKRGPHISGGGGF